MQGKKQAQQAKYSLVRFRGQQRRKEAADHGGFCSSEARVLLQLMEHSALLLHKFES
jgi:hypothetical protein